MSEMAWEKVSGGGGALVWVLLLMLMVAGPAWGDDPVRDRLDDRAFIEGLRERGMTELLEYYLDENPPADPLEEQALRIELAKAAYENTSLPAERRARAVDEVVASYRRLIEAAPPGHHQLPIWRTELSEFILRVALPVRHLNAGEFVEFGLATPAARRAFDELAVEAYEQMEEAYLDAFELQGALPRQRGFQTEYVNTGFWARLNDEFIDRRIPFAYGWASYYATLASEPSGSLDEALDQLAEIDEASLNDAARAELNSVFGRVLVAAERFGEARERFDAVAALTEDAISGPALWARLSWVHALHEAGRTDAAVEAAQAILTDFREAGGANPPLVIMVYDAWHRVTGDHDVYERLFEDSLVSGVEEQVRSFVATRLAADPMTPEQLASEPPLVVLAHADAMVERAVETAEADDRAAASVQFSNARRVLTELIERSGVDERTEAQARFRLGSLEYQRDGLLRAVEEWVELGRLYPDRPEGLNATVNAFSLAHSLYRQQPDTEAVVEAFDAASATLLEHQPRHRLAEQHTYTRAAFLRRQRRFDEALLAYQRVPNDHEFFADAMYEIAVVHHTRWVEAEAADRAARAEDTLHAVERALTVLDQESPRRNRASLREKHGDALLIKAEVLLQQPDAAGEAYVTLERFAEEFASVESLSGRYQRLRVNAAVARGEFEEARDRVRAFAEGGVDEGGALIQHTLESVNRRAEDLRELGDAEAAAELDRLSVELAEDLVAWAERQPEFEEDPRRRLTLELILARQLRAAGRLDESRELLETLYAREYGTNDAGETVTGADQLEVLYELSRTALAQGDEDRARPLVNQVLRRHPTQEGRTWWHSWVMSLGMLDSRYDALLEAGEEQEAREVSERIIRHINRLRHADEQLGGEQYRRELERLVVRHQGN